jgi:hypothetical protein
MDAQKFHWEMDRLEQNDKTREGLKERLNKKINEILSFMLENRLRWYPIPPMVSPGDVSLTHIVHELKYRGFRVKQSDNGTWIVDERE